MADLPQYRRILLATDGSASADLAAHHAVALARATGADLTALYVVDTHQAFRLGIHQHDALLELRQDGAHALAQVTALGAAAGVAVETELHEGQPRAVILHAAKAGGADLIVVGSHGGGALEEMLLGSIAQHIVHHADVPVCIVRLPRI